MRFLNRSRAPDDTPSMSVQGTRSRMPFVAACLALLTLCGGVVVSHASTADRLDHARARLRALSDEIAAQSATVADARARAAAADARAAEAGAALIPLTVHQVEVSQRIDDLEAQRIAAQDELNASVVETFIGSPGSVPGADTLTALLGATSIADLQDRMAFGAAVAEDRANVVAQAARLDARLRERAAMLDDLAAAAADVRARRDEALAEQQAALAQEQEGLAELDAARDEIVALIDRLRERLAPQDVADVADAFQGTENISYGEWAHAFLRVMGAPRCHANLVVTIAWQAQEGTQAAWNPLATTHRMEGSTDFNSVGVQNYRSLAQGLAASRETVENGWDLYGYGPIIESMRGCADPMATARAIADSRWCYGCAGGQYVLGIVPAVQESFETYSEL